MYTIIDVSDSNSIKSWDTVKDHVDGVILRVGYRGYGKAGNIKIDAKFDKYVQRLIALRIPWGVYMITQAVCSTEGAQEYYWVKETLSHYDCKDMLLGIWCDTEWSGSATRTGRGDLINKYDRTSAVCGFCDALIKDNQYGGIYASESWLSAQLVWSIVKNYKLWVANYSKKPNISCDMWQKTNNGVIDGVNRRVDVSERYVPIIKESNPIVLNPYQEPTRTIYKGCKGDDVKWVQWELNQKGYNLQCDGSFGKLSDTALRDYQRVHLLKVDGRCGSGTRSCMKND